jgi:hypothetical protein
MKILIGLGAAFIIAAVWFGFVSVGLSKAGLQVIQTLVFLASLAAFFKWVHRNSLADYLSVTFAFLIVTLAVIVGISTKFSQSTLTLHDQFMLIYTVLIDWIAGLFVGLTVRIVQKKQFWQR